jgi:hypothetical protein
VVKDEINRIDMTEDTSSAGKCIKSEGYLDGIKSSKDWFD